MAEPILFSVIIPLYNKAAYIQKAVESVLRQTHEAFELIIVNDGSTDDSLAVVQAMQDARIRILDQPNRGVAAARNNGVAVTRYESVAFLDGDDWWDETFLARMAELIVDFPAAGIYGCQYFWVKNGRQKVSANHKSPGFAGYLDYFAAYTHAWWMPLTSISVVIRKTVFQEMGGFKTQLKFGEDFDLWVRIALKHKVAYLNQPLAYYNQDVAAAGRALGSRRWKTAEHFLFNLDYLAEAEQANPPLKYLLDGLRVRGLMKFYLRNDHPNEVNSILKLVDLEKQSTYYQRIYTLPKFLVRRYLNYKMVGSVVKQRFIRYLK